MTKRRQIILMMGFAVIVAGIVGFLYPWPAAFLEHRINDESFKLIKKGMTQEEVEAILRAPPGDYSTQHRTYIRKISLAAGLTGGADSWVKKLPLGYQKKRWAYEEWCIEVLFDPVGKIETYRRLTPSDIPEESLIAKNIRRLFRQ